MSFARYTPEEAAVHQPRILVLNEKNEIVATKAVLPSQRLRWLASERTHH
jgi:aspartate 1-decarboxylase